MHLHLNITSMNKDDYKIVKRKIVFDSPKIRVVTSEIKLPNGVVANWYHITGDEIVAAVVVDDAQNIYLAREWRVAVEDFIYSLPAGATKANTEKERKQEINRELQEEIGFKAKNIEKLVEVYSNSHNNRKLHVYLATNLEKSSLEDDDSEIVGIEIVPLTKIIEFLTQDNIYTTGSTLAAIFLAMNRINL